MNPLKNLRFVLALVLAGMVPLAFAQAAIPAPVTAVALVGKQATITVTCDGTAPFTYVWRKDGVILPAATSASLVLANLTQAQAGVYTVTIANSAGSTTAPTATLTVNLVPPSVIGITLTVP